MAGGDAELIPHAGRWGHTNAAQYIFSIIWKILNILHVVECIIVFRF